MVKIRKRFPFKIIFYILLLAVLYVLQGSVFPAIPIFGAKPIFLPLAVAGIAMFEGCTVGGVLGMLGGILCDMSLNQPAIQFTLVMTGMGLLAGAMSETLFAKGFPTYLLIGFVSILLTAIVQVFGLFVFQRIEISMLLYTAMFQCLYSLVFLLPVYILVRGVSRLPS